MEGSSEESKFRFRVTKFKAYVAEPAKSFEEAAGK